MVFIFEHNLMCVLLVCVIVLRIHDHAIAVSAADCAEPDGPGGQNACTGRLGCIEARGDEGDFDEEPLGLVAQQLAPEGALEEARRKAVADTLKNIGACENLGKRGCAVADGGLHLRATVGLKRGAVVTGRGGASDGELEVREHSTVGEGAKVAPDGPAHLVEVPLVKFGLALGDAGAESGNVGAEHLCFLAKSVWVGLTTANPADVISIFKLFVNHIKITRNKTFMIVLSQRNIPSRPIHFFYICHWNNLIVFSTEYNLFTIQRGQ